MTVRKEFGLQENHVVVGKVARLFELKGHDDVLEAAATLADGFPELRLLFVGGGVWRERLQAKAAALGLASRVVFTGLVPPARIPELLGACDLVVHASYREGLARVLPQALLSGKPVVSYSVDGAPEVVLPEKTGFLVSPGDVSGLAEGMRRLIADPALRRRLGETGRALFTDRFRHETMTAEIRRVYEDVLRERD